MNTILNNIKSSFFLLVITLFFFEAQLYAQSKTQIFNASTERFIKVGNHRLFTSEKGNKKAKFTVVFESGAGGSSQDWAKVIALLPAGIRTVAYDRAGLGKSEAGPLPQTMAQSVFELHRLLKNADIDGPIILVGQSIGGLIVRLYTKRYGKDIVGLVLVDPTHESSMLGSLRYGGWVRLREKASGKPVPQPQLKDSISPGYDSTADYMAEEFQNIYLSSKKNPQQLGSRPLIILGAGIRPQPPGTPDDQWQILRKERDQQLQYLTVLSSNAKFILCPQSSHAIQNDKPETVARSIQMIIDAITANTKL